MKKYLGVLVVVMSFSACKWSSPKRETVEQSVESELVYLLKTPDVAVKNPPMLVLLHGMGSDENDLFGLAAMLDKRLLVVSVRAPYPAQNGRFQWYAYQRRTATEAVIDEAQAAESRRLVMNLVEQMVQKYGVSAVYVAGFSQGAMMSYGLGLTQPDKVAGLASFSGRIPDDVKRLMAKDKDLERLEVFISHGKRDAVISYDFAVADRAFLENKGIVPSFFEYSTAHSMSTQNLSDFREWMNQQVMQNYDN